MRTCVHTDTHTYIKMYYLIKFPDDRVTIGLATLSLF